MEQNATETIAVGDGACAAGFRLVTRTGTLITRFDVFDFYDGPVPLDRFNLGGNESNFRFEWVGVVETNLGCG